MPKNKNDNDSNDDNDNDGDDDDSSSKFTTDKFGNTLSKIEAKQRAADEKIRSAAKARRLAKATATAVAIDGDASVGSSGTHNNNCRPQWLQEYDKVKAKLAEGKKKLSGKEKKLLKRGEARVAEDKELGITYGNDDNDNDNDNNNNTNTTIAVAAEVARKALLQRLEGFSFSVDTVRGGSSRGDGDNSEEDAAATVTSSRDRDVVIKGLSISAPAKPLLVNADVTLSHGRRYGLIGANGRGKSTLLRFLAARKLPGIPSTLDILLVEQEVAASDTHSILADVLSADTHRATLLQEEQTLFAILEQDGDNNNEGEEEEKTATLSNKQADTTAVPNNSNHNHNSLEIIVARITAISEELDAIGAENAEARARVILSGLGFTTTMVDNSTSTLSGGWRMRVSLAKALFVAPRLLLLDEPTNHLDLDALLWLDSYLTTKFPTTSTVLTVSHDRDFLDEICTDLILLTDDGGLEYHTGGVDRLNAGLASRIHKRTKDYALQQKMLKTEQKKHPNLKLEKIRSRIATKLQIPRLAEKPREYKVQFELVAPDDAKTAPGLSVDLRDVHFSYGGGSSSSSSSSTPTTNAADTHEGAFLGFQGLNLCIDANTRAAIVGANGSGKSTLLKLIAGILEPTKKGEINRGRKLKIGYYDQHFSELKNCKSNASAVDFLLSNYATSLSSSAQEARKWLGKFGLDSARHVIPIKDLSGGQKARVCFASIALRRPHLLILDEPTNHLDLESCDALIEGLESYNGGVLAVTHDVCLVDALSRDADGFDMPLYVCKDSTVVLERGGFTKYKRDLEAAAAVREKREAAEARKRAARRAKEHRNRLTKFSAS